MTFDVRTAFLVATAIGTPLLLQKAGAAGVPGVAIKPNVTGGQKAALASFGTKSTDPWANGGALADTQSFAARVLGGHGVVPAMSGLDANDLAGKLIAAVEAGAAAPSEPYFLQQHLTGFASVFGYEGGSNETVDASMPRSSLGEAYDAVKSATLYAPEADDSDGRALAMLCYQLALEMDDQGYQIDGKPMLSIAGGLGAAGTATAAWVGSKAGSVAGSVVLAAANALLSGPGLILIGGLLLYRAASR